MSKNTGFCEEYWSMKYMVQELTKEMATLLKHEIKQIHEKIDRMEERSWKRPTQNLYHPTRRTWRSLNEDDESVDRHSFVSNQRRPSQATQSFCARMDQWIKDGLQEDKLENIMRVIGFDSSADTDDEGEADPEILSEEESNSKMPESNVPCEDMHEVSNEITLISKMDVTQNSDVEEEQQENIFHSKSNVKDKVCSLIIVGGCCTNVASVTMEEMLELSILKHPKPYLLQWPNDSDDVKVTKQVKVPFLVGKDDHVKIQEESVPKKKKKKKKKKGKDIMQWLFLARIEGFVFDPGIEDSDLRTNPSQEEGNDGVQGSLIQDPNQVPNESIIRARAKKFKDVVHGLIQEVWAQGLSKKPIEESGPSSPRITNLIEANGLELEDNLSYFCGMLGHVFYH